MSEAASLFRMNGLLRQSPWRVLAARHDVVSAHFSRFQRGVCRFESILSESAEPCSGLPTGRREFADWSWDMGDEDRPIVDRRFQTEDRVPSGGRERMKGDDIASKLLAMAVSGIRMADTLPRTPAGRHLAGQLLRSVTACGANYEEARGAESRRDFIHKLAIAHKEAHETRSWVRLAFAAHLLEPAAGVPELLLQLDSICRILGKSIGTARARAETQLRPSD